MFLPDTSPKCPRTLCHSGFRMVRCWRFPASQQHIGSTYGTGVTLGSVTSNISAEEEE